MGAKDLGGKKNHAFNKKRIRDLAQDDYVDKASHTDISESDIHAPFGATVKDSNAESREAKAVRSWARREAENDDILRERLEKLNLNELRREADAMGLDSLSDRSKEAIIQKIMEAGH